MYLMNLLIFYINGVLSYKELYEFDFWKYCIYFMYLLCLVI